MKYDREWLRHVRVTKNIIDRTRELIDQVPDVQDRRLLKQTFSAHSEAFMNDLEYGFDNTKAAGTIYELYALVEDLIGGADKCDAEYSPPAPDVSWIEFNR